MADGGVEPRNDRWGRFARGLLSRFGRISARRRERHHAILSTPFPQAWTAFLEAQFPHYRRLPPAYRVRLEQQLQIFLAEKRLSGIEMEVTEETRLQVATSAVALTAGWPDYTWDQLTEVLLYPDDFDRDYRFGGHERSGIAHPGGTVISSYFAQDPAAWTTSEL